MRVPSNIPEIGQRAGKLGSFELSTCAARPIASYSVNRARKNRTDVSVVCELRFVDRGLVEHAFRTNFNVGAEDQVAVLSKNTGALKAPIDPPSDTW